MKPFEFDKPSTVPPTTTPGPSFGSSNPKAGSPDPASLRAPQRPERVQDETLRWLASLPEHVRPTELTRRFPRIANKIAALWKQVARCEEFLDQLVVDRRGGRKGFPMAIAQELTVLRRHYAALHPSSSTAVWDMEGKGR